MQVEHSPHVYKTFLCSCFHQDAFNAPHQLQFILTTLEMFKNVTNDLQSIGTQIMKVCHTNVSSKIWQLIKSMHPAIHTSSGYVNVNNYFTYFYGCSCFWPHLVEMMWVNLVFINTSYMSRWLHRSHELLNPHDTHTQELRGDAAMSWQVYCSVPKVAVSHVILLEWAFLSNSTDQPTGPFLTACLEQPLC